MARQHRELHNKPNITWLYLAPWLSCIACGGEISLDAGADATLDTSPVDEGGLFTCEDDVCDGRTHYCDTTSYGPPQPWHCVPLPDGCVPASCACLPNADSGQGCKCEYAPTGGGFMAGCGAP